MQTQNPFFDDLARMAGGALGALSGLKAEVETLVRQQFERFMAGADMVPRDEFEAVRALAIKARSEQEDLEVRVAALEAKLADLAGGEKQSS
ncbi:MAG: accessory factor UbiK family protein [Rhodospirillaceae bacterium]|nr:accessory factor UbiK family protein [Rhodospirillales bacterium]